MRPDIRLEDLPPPVEDYIRLRASCGWGEASPDVAALVLASSVLAVTARDARGHVVGFGRATGDPLYLLITDVIVVPSLRGRSLGDTLMRRLVERLKHDHPEATIMLMCAKGREAFYERLGFESRPSEGFGPGMHMMPGKGAHSATLET